MERAEIWSLRNSQSYEMMVTVSEEMRRDLSWWLNDLQKHNGMLMQWDRTIKSMQGWGANTSTGGSWSIEESQHHINYLELLVVFLALKTFASMTHSTENQQQ